jgi:hypothetical protein
MSIQHSGDFDVPEDFELAPDEPGFYPDAWSQGALSWQLHFYDGDERKWVGYINGEPTYWVHRGSFGCGFDNDFHDACLDEMEGINACETHWRKRAGLPPLPKQQPLNPFDCSTPFCHFPDLWN